MAAHLPICLCRTSQACLILQDLTEVEVYDSVFFNNSAIVGGAQWVNRAANMVQYQGNFTLNLAQSVSSPQH